MLDVGFWMLVEGGRFAPVLENGCWMLDVGPEVRSAGFNQHPKSNIC
jgi:hypothetical protein